jgi:hypothetical protein
VLNQTRQEIPLAEEEIREIQEKLRKLKEKLDGAQQEYEKEHDRLNKEISKREQRLDDIRKKRKHYDSIGISTIVELDAQEPKYQSEKAQKEKLERQLQKQKDWPQKNGFDENGNTWIFVKGDTYAIKDSLKENGYRFNRELGWHGTKCLEDLPEGYEIYQIGFHEVYEFPFETASAPDFIGEQVIADAKSKAGEGEFVGEIGERLRALDVQLMSVREYNGAYGLSYIYQFSYKGDILIWMTSKWMDIEPNEWYVLTGTVKKHESYKGMNQTYLSRCIVKEK